ncbi:MAG: glycosyltransferase [bacterium]|nr:glycosyltransferase [bacterium]
MKVALVHDYLNQFGGGERVLEALAELYPEAPIYTALYDRAKIAKGSPMLASQQIITPNYGRLPFVHSFYKWFTFLYPLAFEAFDLSAYDLVISSSANFAKGVLTNANQKHISYIHTPPRFLYGYKTEESRRDKWLWRQILRPVDYFLRLWDFQAAQRPDVLVANSQETARRIRKFYRREATVVYPPVTIPEVLESDLQPDPNGSFLIVSRLSEYKHVDIVIEAANQLGFPLKVAGTGKEQARISRLAGPTVEMLGFVSEERLTQLYRSCRAFISPVEDEEFGIVAVEAMAYGRPVIALRQGGYLETVVEGKTGMFFEKPTVESLAEVWRSFKAESFDPQTCRNQALRFSKERFQKEIKDLVANCKLSVVSC